VALSFGELSHFALRRQVGLAGELKERTTILHAVDHPAAALSIIAQPRGRGFDGATGTADK
jgi:hypothetical protein